MDLSRSQIQQIKVARHQLTDEQRANLAERERDTTKSRFIAAAQTETALANNEEKKEDLSWPITTVFILVIELSERFCYYGLRSILLVYIEEYLGRGKSTAKSWYHDYGAYCYITPLVGSIIADTYWGRYKTIRNLSVIYIIGTVLVAISAVPTWFYEDRDRTTHANLLIAGLVFIGTGAGGIKPCVAAFGADQFDKYALKAKTQYFKFFYMIINIGAFISSWLTPKMSGWDCYSKTKQDVRQFYQKTNEDGTVVDREPMCEAFDSCQISAYALTAALMIIAFSLLITPPMLVWKYNKANQFDKADKFTYKRQQLSKENIMIETMKCYGTAISNVLLCKKSKNKVWDENLESKLAYDKRMLEEGFFANSDHHSARIRRFCKRMTAIMILFIPIICFWFVFEQIGSYWVYQAKSMDLWVKLPFSGYTYIYPTQIEALNSVYIIILIPIFNYFLPNIRKIVYGVKNPDTKDPDEMASNEEKLRNEQLHFMFLGLILTTLTCVVTWSIQKNINSYSSWEDTEPGIQQIRVLNTDPIINRDLLNDFYFNQTVNSNSAHDGISYRKLEGGNWDGEKSGASAESEDSDLDLSEILNQAANDGEANEILAAKLFSQYTIFYYSEKHVNDTIDLKVKLGDGTYVPIKNKDNKPVQIPVWREELDDKVKQNLAYIYCHYKDSGKIDWTLPENYCDIKFIEGEPTSSKSAGNVKIIFPKNDAYHDQGFGTVIDEVEISREEFGCENFICPEKEESWLQQVFAKKEQNKTDTQNQIEKEIIEAKKFVYLNFWLGKDESDGNRLQYLNGAKYLMFQNKVNDEENQNLLIKIVSERKLGFKILLFQYLCMSVAEVFISTTGLEFSYNQSPPPMKTIVTAIFYFVISLAHKLISGAEVFAFSTVQFMFFNILAAIGATILYVVIAKTFPMMSTGEIEWMNRSDTPDDEEADGEEIAMISKTNLPGNGYGEDEDGETRIRRTYKN